MAALSSVSSVQSEIDRVLTRLENLSSGIQIHLEQGNLTRENLVQLKESLVHESSTLTPFNETELSPNQRSRIQKIWSCFESLNGRIQAKLSKPVDSESKMSFYDSREIGNFNNLCHPTWGRAIEIISLFFTTLEQALENEQVSIDQVLQKICDLKDFSDKNLQIVKGEIDRLRKRVTPEELRELNFYRLKFEGFQVALQNLETAFSTLAST